MRYYYKENNGGIRKNHMKLSCTQENLATGLSIVCPVAGKGGTLPILHNIMLEARDGALELKSTNLEIGVVARIRGKVEEDGVFTVSGKLFHDYVNLVDAERVVMSLDGEHLVIQAGNQQTRINGLSADEFPVIPTVGEAPAHTLDSADFKEALSQTVFAVSVNDARPEISGVYLLFENSTLTMAGTDSYRLAEKKITLVSGSPEKIEAIVPLRTMQELGRILGQVSGELSIIVNDNQVLFRVADVELVSRVISGNYPNYQQIIPQNVKTTVTLDKEPLARAIKSASLFCRQGLNHVNVQFSSDKVLVSASASQVGENTIEVPAKVEGSDVDIIFDFRFLLDGFSSMRESSIVIKLDSATSPGVFATEDSSYLYLVMPIRQ